jgi:hypothetical protein
MDSLPSREARGEFPAVWTRQRVNMADLAEGATGIICFSRRACGGPFWCNVWACAGDTVFPDVGAPDCPQSRQCIGSHSLILFLRQCVRVLRIVICSCSILLSRHPILQRSILRPCELSRAINVPACARLERNSLLRM